MERFILCNKERYNRIVEEAKGYIRSVTENFNITDMFVSFSGGKDSTVTADLVTRALSNPQIMHIFLEIRRWNFRIPMNMFRDSGRIIRRHLLFPQEIKKKDFEELCKLVGYKPCDAVVLYHFFKTGTIQKKNQIFI